MKKTNLNPVRSPHDFMTPQSYRMNLRWAQDDPRWTNQADADQFMVDTENIQRGGMRAIRKHNDPLHLDYSKPIAGLKIFVKMFFITGFVCMIASIAMDAKDTHGFNHAYTMRYIAQHKAYLKHHKHHKERKVIIPMFVWMDHEFAKMEKEEKLHHATAL